MGRHLEQLAPPVFWKFTPEHLQYIDDMIVWGDPAEEVFEKGKKIVQILLKAGFAIKQKSKDLHERSSF